MNRCPYQWDAALMLTAWVTVPACVMRWVAHTKSLSQVHKGYFGNAYTGCRFDLCRENQCSAGSQCNPANGQCECREGYALINGVCQSPLWLVLRLTSFYRLSVRLNQLLQLKISMVMLWATYSPRSMVQTITPQTSIVSILSLHHVLMGTVYFFCRANTPLHLSTNLKLMLRDSYWTSLCFGNVSLMSQRQTGNF